MKSEVFFCSDLNQARFLQGSILLMRHLIGEQVLCKIYPGNFFLFRLQRLVEVVAPPVLEEALVAIILVRVPDPLADALATML